MKRILEFLGVVALVQGAVGLLHELTGWLGGWGLVQRAGFLDGYEVYASLALLALAVVLFTVAERRRSG